MADMVVLRQCVQTGNELQCKSNLGPVGAQILSEDQSSVVIGVFEMRYGNPEHWKKFCTPDAFLRAIERWSAQPAQSRPASHECYGLLRPVSFADGELERMRSHQEEAFKKMKEFLTEFPRNKALTLDILEIKASASGPVLEREIRFWKKWPDEADELFFTLKIDGSSCAASFGLSDIRGYIGLRNEQKSILEKLLEKLPLRYPDRIQVEPLIQEKSASEPAAK